MYYMYFVLQWKLDIERSGMTNYLIGLDASSGGIVYFCVCIVYGLLIVTECLMPQTGFHGPN